MKTNTIRTLFKIGIIAAAIVFVIMLWDYFQNESDLMDILTIVAAVLLVILFIMLFLPKGRDTETVYVDREVMVEPQDDGLDYLGDVHEVVDLEGIGPTYARKLKAMGIEHTQQLLMADPKEVAVQTGAASKTVANWRAMSQLVKIRGVGPQYAEAAVRAGIDGIEELRDEPAAAIAGAIQGYLDSLDSTVIGQKVTTKRVEGWQKAARKLKRGEIDMDNIKVMPLESKAAKADAGA